MVWRISKLIKIHACFILNFVRKKLFYGEGTQSKNVGHQGWVTTKNFEVTLKLHF